MKLFNYRVITINALILTVIGCTSTGSKVDEREEKPYEVQKSFLSGNSYTAVESDIGVSQKQKNNVEQFLKLQSLREGNSKQKVREEMSAQFSDQLQVTLAADNMPMPEFLHYAFGEVLGANYVISPDLKNTNAPVTLNVQNAINKQQLFLLVSKLLSEKSIHIDFNEGVFFLQGNELGKSKAVIGIGRDVSSVPNVSGQILQVIPIKYGIKLSLERTIRELVDATINVDFEQSSLFVLGTRTNVLRTIELVNMLDVPANRGKNIGLLTTTYLSIEDFTNQLKSLMLNEGVKVGVVEATNANVVLVPLPNIGGIAVFSTESELLDRVKYWANVIDRPSKGETEQYFLYHPMYARAKDIGDSLGQLLTLGGGRPSTKKGNVSTGSGANTLKGETVSANRAVNSNNVSFVVDERSNAIIFSTTGSHYQKLQPLLRKLDVLPKQVLLDVVIAEVTMSGDFKYGIEFALQQNDYLNFSTVGALGQDKVSGLTVGYVDGANKLLASFFKENKYVNIVSKPTLLVRDGTEANINVGTQIPVVTGSISIPGNGSSELVQSNSVSYRQTGVNIAVTPTINAQGVVIMTINQEISNTVSTTAASNTPSIFQRTLSTEVVANSGRTVMLAGLISENKTQGKTKVPGFGDLPILGKLFAGENNENEKTELVMLVTPRVLDNNDQWQKIMEDFQTGLENIRISN